MIIKEVKCLNPRFIVNPSLLHLLTIHRKYMLNGVVRNVSNSFLTLLKFEGLNYFCSYLASVGYDNINNYGVIDNDTGELLPMFLAVPCGKCKCCKAKKALDWKVRAICESATAVCPPLFVTLTYAPQWLPKDGVNKRDVQLFLKRLRSRLEYAGKDISDLRYFIVGEYGSNTMRAHYHALIWNFPYYDRFIDKIDIIHDSWQCGNIMCSSARDLSGAYCMKYMQKDNKHPDGTNEPFFLSSRGKGGLGIKWLQDNFEYYRKFPQETSIKVRTFDGEVKELPMPVYFQRKLYPSKCGLIPIKIRKALDLWLNYKFLAMICADYCRKTCVKIRYNTYDEDKIYDFFKFFGLVDDEYDLSQVYNYFSFIHKDLRTNIHNEEYLKLSFQYYHRLEHVNASLLLDWIGDLKLHIKEISDILDLGDIHKQFVSSAMEKLPAIELDDYIYQLDNILAKSLQKEIF